MKVLYYKKFFKSDKHDWVVFLHGAGGSSSVWFKQLRDFRKKFNVLLVDLRGHGKSQDPELLTSSHYSLTDVTEDVVNVLDDAKIEKAHFIGISIGSVVTRVLADMQPKRVQSMILGGALPWLNAKAKFLFGYGNIMRRLMPYLWLYKLFAYIVMPMKNHAESRNLFITEAQKASYTEFVKWYRLIAINMHTTMKRLSYLDTGIPTLYIMGEQDHMFLPQVKKLAKDKAEIGLKIIKGAGHVCNVDKAEEFNNDTIDFISTHALKPV